MINDYTKEELMAELVIARQRIAELEAVETELKHTKEALQKTNIELEQRVQERTARLSATNASLEAEISNRKIIEHNLTTHQLELEMQNDELRTIQKQLAISRKNYINLYEFAPISYFTFNKRGEILELNLTGSKLLGKDKQYMLRKPFVVYLVRDDYEKFFIHCRQALETKELQSCEIQLAKNDGTIIDVQLESIAAQDDRGEFNRIHTAILDITDRKQAAEALRKSEARLNRAQQIAHIASWDINLQTQECYWSDEHYRILGYRPTEVVGSTELLAQHTHADDLPVIQEALQQAINNQSHLDVQYRIIRGDGKMRYTHTLAEFEIDEAAPQGRLIGTFQDITDRVLAEKTMRENENRLKAIVNALPDTYFLFDETGNYLDLVATEDDWLRENKEHVVGKNVGEVLSTATADFFLKVIQQTIDQQAPQIQEYKPYGQRGHRWFEIRTSLITTLPGDSRKLIWVCRDITERKQTEQALAQRETYLVTLVDLQRRLLAFVSSPANQPFPYEEILCLLGQVSLASRVYVYENSYNAAGHLVMVPQAEWTADTITARLDKGQCSAMPYEPVFSRWHHHLAQGEIIRGQVVTFPEVERTILEEHQILSLLVLPLMVHGEFFGFIGFDACLEPRTWNSSEISFLESAAAAISLAKEQQQTALALSKSQQNFATVLDSMETVVYVADMQSYDILFINKYARHYFGDVIGMRCWQSFQKDQQGPCSFCTNKFLVDEHGQPTGVYTWEFRNTLTNRWFYIQDQAIRWTDGRLVRLEIATDITERKQAERKLRLTQERLELALRVGNLAWWDWEYPTGHLNFDQRKAEMLGYQTNELEPTRETFTDKLHPDDSDQVTKAMEAHLQGQTPVYETEYRLQTKSGEWRWFYDRGEVIEWDKNRQPKRLVGIVMETTDRKQAQAELEEQKNFLFAVIDTIPDMVFAKDTDSRLILANQAYCELIGRDREELLGRGMDELHSPEVADKFYDHDRQVFESNKPIHQEDWFATAYGKKELLETVKVPFKKSDGSLSGLVAVSRKITERKQAEEILWRSRETARALLDATIDAAFLIDRQGIILAANETTARDFNRQVRKIVGLNSYTLLPLPLAKNRHLKNLEVIKSGKPAHFEDELNGRILDNRVYPLFDKQGHVERLAIFSQDITERRRAEQALRASEERMRLMLENVRDYAIFMLNPQGHIVSWNYGAERIKGYSAEEIMGQHFSRFYPPETIEAGKPAYVLKTATQKGQFIDEGWRIKKDGSPFWAYVVVNALYDQKGKLHGFVKVTRDVTERKLAQEALQEAKEAAEVANQAKSEFLANMSHELRTPLNAILGYTQILKRDDSLTKKQHEGIEIIQHSGEHLLQMINDILDLAKIEAGKMEPDPVEFHLHEFLKVIAEIINIRAEQKGISFTYEFQPNLPTYALADDKFLRQILLNLLSNAVKFTEQGQVIFIVNQLPPEESPSLVRFQVTDTGIGIPAERLDEIFLPFHQVSNRQHKVEGTGLGLAISRRLVHLIGGDLNVESQIGQGSTFWFDLPLPEITTDKPMVNITSRQIVGLKGNCRRLLIVDDNPENRLVLKEMLQPLGFKITEAVDGQEAINKALISPPNLILMDLMMPGLDGFKATQQIRNTPQLKEVVIVGVSASVEGQVRQRCLEVGCNDFIAKPVSFDNLLTCLQHHLKLDWHYQPLESSLADQEAASQAIILPSTSELQGLLELAELGYISGIQDMLTNLEHQDKKFTPFIFQIEQLTESLEFEKIVTYLKEQLKGKTE